jgi:hypothetical protein
LVGVTELDATVRELAVISIIAVLALGLAWAQEQHYFAMFFGASAAIAILEAVRRSV